MDLQTELHWIQAELRKVKDPDLIRAIKSLLKYNNKRFQNPENSWAEISEAERLEIEAGIKDVEEGRLFSHEEVMENVQNRFSKLLK